MQPQYNFIDWIPTDLIQPIEEPGDFWDIVGEGI